jgi:TonB family protein
MTGSMAHRTLVPPRITALTGIVALHVLIAYLLLTALVQPPPGEAPSTRATVSVESNPPHVPPPIPLKNDAIDKVPRPPHELQVPKVDFTAEVSAEVPGIEGSAEPQGPVLPPVTPEPIRVLGKHWLPSSEAYYPPDLIRNGVQGGAQVRVCVDGAGRLADAPTLERSSGNARLDQAALNIARDGHYARAVRGDAPVPNCYRFHITFRL